MRQKNTAKPTPLMTQYASFKAQYPDALLLFRVGDFYETFGEDAVCVSEILDIVLTKRANGSASAVPLAGFPHHALDNYLPKLVRAGYRVAICDQLETPQQGKKLVKRGVTELVTPGLAYHDEVLSQKHNNYLAALHFGAPRKVRATSKVRVEVGLALLDVSTGEFMVAQGSPNYIDKLLRGLQPAEFVYNKADKSTFQAMVAAECPSYGLPEWVYTLDYAYERLRHHFGTTSVKGFGIEDLPLGIVAAGAVLRYLEETEHRQTGHLKSIARLPQARYVGLDRFTIDNLELVQPQQRNGVALLQVLDGTTTAMGARLLKKWLLLPLKEVEAIQQRLDTVEELFKDAALTQALREGLAQMGDLERLTAKVAARRVNPRELLQLQQSLTALATLLPLLQEQILPQVNALAELLDPLPTLVEQLSTTLTDNPPLQAHQGGVIRTGVDEALDALRKLAYEGKDFLEQLQKQEREHTGITSLKVSYNRVFGYYFEVTHAHKDKVPSHWVRKQTLVNAERYITEELKNYEEQILSAEERMQALEQKHYQLLVEATAEWVHQLQCNAHVLGQLDVYATLAHLAHTNGYVKPQVTTDDVLDIQQGRHPVIEQQLPMEKTYVPNDVRLDHDTQQILLITGPNMAGKSALLRQVALIALMAQMGSFVPAKAATIGVVDQVFTRVGASDNLAQGESTFMVEMTETASILHNVTPRSLVLMDEIGRGTSTYDGMSIAWAILEHLHNQPHACAKTLFATHYHELSQLEHTLPRLKNFHVAVQQVQGKILFLHQLRPGDSPHSFGIHVAQLAGLPTEVVQRAQHILQTLEATQAEDLKRSTEAVHNTPPVQLKLFEADPTLKQVGKALCELTVDQLTPMEALMQLHTWQKQLQEKN